MQTDVSVSQFVLCYISLIHSPPHNLHPVHLWIISVFVFVFPLTDSKSLTAGPVVAFSLRYRQDLLSISTAEAVFPRADFTAVLQGFLSTMPVLSFLILLIISCQKSKTLSCQTSFSEQADTIKGNVVMVTQNWAVPTASNCRGALGDNC